MYKLSAYGLTDVGMKRDHNEDYFGIENDLNLFIVCDGMGGHASGEVASRLTVEHVIQFISEHGDKAEDQLEYDAPGATCLQGKLLSNAVQHANYRVFVEAMKDSKLEGMGTTLVALLACDDKMVVAHVGDSRLYRYRSGVGLQCVTRDHSLLNHKIDRGELRTEEEIKNFRQGNVIVRAMGLKDDVLPEVQTVDRQPGDVFLLCSDGLTDLVEDWAIENVIDANEDDLDEAAACFIRMANDRGGKDNITALLVRVDDEVADAYDDELTIPAGMPAMEDDDEEEEEVTEPTLPKVDLTATGRPVPEWCEEDGALVQDDAWPEDADDSEESLGGSTDSEALESFLESSAEPPPSIGLSTGTSEKSMRITAPIIPPVPAATPSFDLDSVSELALPEQVALVALSNALVEAGWASADVGEVYFDQLRQEVGHDTLNQGRNIRFEHTESTLNFLNTVHRRQAQKQLYAHLVDLVTQGGQTPADSELVLAIGSHWDLPLPLGGGGMPQAPEAPPLPGLRRAATVRSVQPDEQTPVASDDKPAPLPKIIIDESQI